MVIKAQEKADFFKIKDGFEGSGLEITRTNQAEGCIEIKGSDEAIEEILFSVECKGGVKLS